MSSGDSGVVDLLVVLDADPESDPHERERLARQLLAELDALDVESVSPVPAGPAPEGSKAADPVTVGAVIVALSASGGVFTALVETLRDWLGRHSGRHRISLTLGGETLELDGASPAQQQELVEAYLRRHSVE